MYSIVTLFFINNSSLFSFVELLDFSVIFIYNSPIITYVLIVIFPQLFYSILLSCVAINL